jgi:hypothetical protein
VSPILFAIYTAGMIKWVEEYGSAEGMSFGNDHGWVATGSDVNQVITILEYYPAKIIPWASRRALQFDSAKMEAALCTGRRGHKKHLRPKLTANITVGYGFIRFNRQVTCWFGFWMDEHLTLKEHHNRCMMEARAAEVRL